MGAHEQDESSPLLSQDAANSRDVAVAVAFVDDTPKAWNGSLLSCCEGCDSYGWGSCLFSYFVPCVAFGQNMKRALDLSALTQAVVYVLLFLTGRAVYLFSSQAVSVACPPQPHGHFGHHEPHGHRPHSHVEPTQTTPLPGSFNSTDLGEQHHHMAPPPMTPECHQAMAAMGATYCLMVLLLVIGVVYAARRRTQIREKFGIAGSKLGDFCAWCWCAPCALCQETRTIWRNNVQDGVWYGQTRLVTAVPAYSAPAMADMKADAKADYKPVDAKDFV